MARRESGAVSEPECATSGCDDSVSPYPSRPTPQELVHVLLSDAASTRIAVLRVELSSGCSIPSPNEPGGNVYARRLVPVSCSLGATRSRYGNDQLVPRFVSLSGQLSGRAHRGPYTHFVGKKGCVFAFFSRRCE